MVYTKNEQKVKWCKTCPFLYLIDPFFLKKYGYVE